MANLRQVLVVFATCFVGFSIQHSTQEMTTMNHDDHTHGDVTHDHGDVTHDHGDVTHNHEDVTHDHGDGDHDMDHGMDHSMQMFFYVSSHATILFEGWHTMVYWELFLSCLAIMVFAILYEGFKEFRQSLLRKNVKVAAKIAQGAETSYKSTEVLQLSSSTEKLGEPDVESDPSTRSSSSLTSNTSMTSQLMNSSHLLQAGLHVLQLFFSYCLMLIFMTYNAYLCIALCLGGGIGYWLFAWKRADVTDPNEHCN